MHLATLQNETVGLADAIRSNCASTVRRTALKGRLSMVASHTGVASGKALIWQEYSGE